MQLGDLAAVAHGDAVALEIVHEVVGHRLVQVRPTVQERHERTAPREPDRGLRRRVPTTDDADAGGAAAPRLGRPGRVEDTDAFELVEARHRQTAVVGAGRQHDGSGRHLVPLLEMDDVPVDTGLERSRAVGRRRAGAELACLGDRARRQLRAADACRKAEVVLDPP